MIYTPKFLQELLSSPEYGDKNSATYKRATKYMNILYPGTVQFDATGRMIRPEYDMTLAQFNDAQGEIDAEFNAAVDEAYEEIMSEYGEYFENIGESFDIDIDTGDAIPVKVLMPNGNIIEKYLDTYELHIPDINIAPKIWRWHSENGENTCDECATMNNRVFFSPDKIPSIPVHPNCQCSVTEETLNEKGKTINIKPYKPTQETRENKSENLEHGGKDVKFEQAYNKLKEREGGYTDGKNQKKDEPTNMGIKQSTLDRYSAKYPEKYLPSDVKNLSEAQVKEIYKSEYWDNTRIPEIKNDRIRDAVFDMNVMGGAGKVVQCALNSFLGANLVVDGAIGSETIKSINAIPDSAVNEFMIALKSERIDYLKETSNWETAKNGWTKRTNKY